MKIAFSGKGGVGKTTLSAAFIKVLADSGRRVLAIDADPNSNLASLLGFSNLKDIKPIVEMKDLIYERMEVSPAEKSSFYKLNPKIDDIPARFRITSGRVSLIVMGTVDAGGSGCVCPESKFLKELIRHIVLGEDEDIIMDMEAGIEHLGRATTSHMDCLVCVVEPSITSIDTALRIKRLATDIGLRTFFLANKISEKPDEAFISSRLDKGAIIGSIPFDKVLNQASRKGESVLDITENSAIKAAAGAIERLNRETRREQKKSPR